MNKKLLEIIEHNERIANLYDIGHVHRAAIETFMEDIIKLISHQFDSCRLDEFLIEEGFLDYPIIEAVR